MATHDQLTGLPNRILFNDRLNQSVATARRNGQKLAVLFLDLDGFKTVNDTLGHAVGDGLLRAIAGHLTDGLRGSDTAARLGGDEFGMLLTNLSGELDAAGMVLDVGVLKRWVRELCDELDERVLVPLENPLVRVEADDTEVTLHYGEKTYRLPREDCVLLPLANTTMEYLAHHLAERLAERLRAEPDAARMTELRVSVSETPGQSAAWN